MIDDLISKGTNEPYRMFTSRAEFRLHLRIDNADRRLTPHGRRVGLISDAAWSDFQAKQQRTEEVKQLLERTKLTSSMLEQIERTIENHVGTAALGRPAEQSSAEEFHEECRADTPVRPPSEARQVSDLSAALGQSLAQCLKRPEISIEQLAPALREIYRGFFERSSSASSASSAVEISSEVRNELKSVETEIKYAGYLDQQQRAIDRLKKAEQRRIPDWFDYRAVSGLSREMQEKLLKIQPQTLGQASRIPGVTPAAVSLVNVYIEIQARHREQSASLQ